ncbi:hypothetical protein L593_12235 [Salinarchaeum sp. Harcht-Bsk1]|uniref:hypothetical protein n=1 Tax=Salinarchaeum sp. Harcht-Bsk1 TaxID=1333523 RepID=UPI000342373F|nr:hypothetical protein [Salinarchaeum sp. Harcht-Bsk1]AGN02390.1 hypothetical protein L593_12235 [Salinarchaeum sp. Harcht-Bsk1]
MELERGPLTILLNALFDAGEDEIAVRHPADEVGELLRIELGDPGSSTVHFPADHDDYANARHAVEREYGSGVSDELPDPRSYCNGLMAGGLVDPANSDDIEAFLDRYGSPDLTAGHKPVVAGFDTNLLPWRIADVLELYPGPEATVNGFALATGVRDELDWDHKRSDTGRIESAFGSEFSALWNQPAGSRREGRLGENYYRLLRDHRYADEVTTDRGDEDIVQGYDAYQDDNRKEVLLFSNDRDFIERARSHRVLAQRVEVPRSLPEMAEASWDDICNALYVLTVLFGVLELPKVTLYGVWQGKGGQAWQREQLRVDCRSPKVEAPVERDLEILSSAE